MCGIAGSVVSPGHSVLASTVQRMGQALEHRGPDSKGHWLGENVGLAHQRLSVIDLSNEGQQPMLSGDGRFALSFNGEIYNFNALRQELSSTPYNGKSDTEVLLRALTEWGVENTVRKLVGMFAFAFYDRQTHALWLVRDRLGVKPLYYGWQGGSFLFASELTAIEAGAAQRPRVCPNALALMMRHNHIPAPYCIYENFHKLSPAHILQIDTAAKPINGACTKSQYWSPESAICQELVMSDAEWQKEFHNTLRNAVRTRLVSDVPVGGFLSGGIDSTLVVALMKEQSDKSVSTYTIGFEETAFNEAEHAKNTARYLGTSHHELYLAEQDVVAAVTKLPDLCDEPFADQSILPTYLLSKMARQNVTVALSGDGGDEILWGYARYSMREQLDHYRNLMPRTLRPVMSQFFSSRVAKRVLGALPTPAFLGRSSRVLDKLDTAAYMLNIDDDNEFYRYFMSHWKNPTTLISGASEPPTIYSHPPNWTMSLPVWRRMCALDLLAYLPNDCLTKVDRASMAVSLEVRVPLLDHRVVEMAYQLPEHLVRHNGVGKVMLRNILNEYVPQEMMDRPKSGFGVPLDGWLRGPLKEWANDLLSDESFNRTGLFDVDMVMALNTQHQAGKADYSAYLWDVLMFLSWDRSRA